VTKANVTITDTLGAGLNYIPGTIKYPPYLTPAWTTDSGTNYLTSEPSSGVNGLKLSAKIVPPYGTGVTMTIPSPLNYHIGNGGDGYSPIAIPQLNRIYSIYHHTTASNGSFSINCLDLDARAICSNYPKSFGTNSGFPNTIYAPSRMRYIIRGYKIYFNATNSSTSPHQLGIACWDTATDQACGFHAFANSTSAENGQSFPVEYDNKLYMVVQNNIYCFDPETNQNCSNFTPTQVLDSSSTYQIYSIGVGGHLILANSYLNSNQGKATCWDLASNSVCSSNWPINLSAHAPSATRDPLPYTDANGNEIGVCFVGSNGGNASYTNNFVNCYNFNGDALPDAYTFTDRLGQDVNGGIYYASHELVGTKVYLSKFYGGNYNQALCWDFANTTGPLGSTAGGPCVGFTDSVGLQGVRDWAQSNQQGPGAPVGTVYPYGYEYYNGCMYGLGDPGILFSFDPENGDYPCQRSAINLETPDINYYCDSQSHNITWNKLEVPGGIPSHVTQLEVTVRDSQDTTILGPTSILSTGELDLSGIPYSGNTKTLKFSAIARGLNERLPILIRFNGDLPQICYKTEVSGQCDLNSVVNTVESNLSSQIQSSLNVEDSLACSVCMNGDLEVGEQCDDGNSIETDSCTNTCVNASCGDAILGPNEQCDDGNALAGDNCSASCTFEFATISGTIFNDLDGDGIKDPNESGLANVVVEITDITGTVQVTTDSNGLFSQQVRTGSSSYSINSSQSVLNGLNVSTSNLSHDFNLVVNNSTNASIGFAPQQAGPTPPEIIEVELQPVKLGMDGSASNLVSIGRSLLVLKNRSPNCPNFSKATRDSINNQAQDLYLSLWRQIWTGLPGITQQSTDSSLCVSIDHSATLNSIRSKAESIHALYYQEIENSCVTNDRKGPKRAKRAKRILKTLTRNLDNWIALFNTYPTSTQECSND
jgi:cysteine-rich repeat protein